MTERVTIVGGGWPAAKRPGASRAAGCRSISSGCGPCGRTPCTRRAIWPSSSARNSLRGNALDQAAGLLKEEMRRMRLADHPRGRRSARARGQRPGRGPRALRAEGHGGGDRLPRVTLHRQETPRIPDGPVVIVATGPLTSDALAAEIAALRGPDPSLLPPTPAVPVVDAETIDSLSHVPRLALRQGRGRLRELPARRSGIRRLLPRPTTAECARAPRLRPRVLLRGMPARRGHRQPRPRHAPLRSHEAGRPRGSATGRRPSPSCSSGRTTWRRAISRSWGSRRSSSGASRSACSR